MSFQPDSLHPYIMDERLKKASGSGGFTLPVASADTLGGIKIGGSANPIKVNGSGNVSIQKATSELLGVVKAGDGISVDADGAISVAGISYAGSSNPTPDTWKDGKQIFIKVITFAEPVTITSSAVDLGTYPDDIDTIIDAAAQGTDSVNSSLMLYKQTGKLMGVTNADFGASSIWIKHTKPTPTP